MARVGYPEEDLALRDKLAIERTKLAEERTSLSYLRTGMSMVLGGLFFVGYFKEGFFLLVGYATIGVSLVFMGYGFYKHQKTMGVVNQITARLFRKK